MTARSSIGLTLLLLLHFLTTATAQYYQEKIFTVKDGLPANSISYVFQDHRGFMWLSSTNGLARFDGYSFKAFHHDAKDSNSLSDNHITVITEDSKNRIWIGTFYAGLNCYDPTTQKFTRYPIPVSKVNNISNQQVTNLVVDARNRLWVSTYNGLYYFDSTRNQLREFLFDSSFVVKNYYNWVLMLVSDGKQFLFVQTNHGIAMVDVLNKQSYYSDDNPLHLKMLGHFDFVTSIFCDSGKIYFVPFNAKEKLAGLYDYDATKNISRLVSELPGKIRDRSYHMILLSHHQILFFQGGAPLLLFNDSTKELRHFQFNDLSSSGGVWLTKNKSGEATIWCSTPSGLHLFTKRSNAFQILNIKSLDKKCESINEIEKLFLTSSHQVFIGSDNNAIALVDSNLKTEQFFERPEYVNRGYNWIWSFYEDHEKKIWFGRQCGYSIYDPVKKSMTDFFLDRNDNTSNRYYVGSSFLQTDDSTIWISSNKGLAEADVRNGRVRKWFTYNPADPKSFPLHRINKIVQDSLNHYWLLSDDGLFSFDPRTKQFKTFQQTIGKSVQFASGEVRDVAAAANKLLIATTDGLYAWNFGSKTLHHFTFSDGLQNEEIIYILAQDENTFWLATPSGLTRFDLIHSTFTNYNYKDGLPSFENDISNMIRLPNGQFIIGADTNLIRFDPGKMKNDLSVPATVITEFTADNQSHFVPEDSLQAIQLSWRNRIINIHFSTLQFYGVDLVQYQYRLEGLDENWTNAFTNNQVNYSNLSSGSYRFEVRAGYGSGVWGKPAALDIDIQNPFWKTWWFWVSVGVILISIPALILWNVISTQRARILQQQRVNLERQRISTELHDDVGSALTKIALLGHALEGDPEKNKNLLQRITTSADSMIDQMNEIIWALNIRNDTVQNLLAYLRKYASDFLEEKFELQIEQPDQIPEYELSGEARRNIFLVVKEALHNVVKHSNAHCVNLIFSINHDLKISISDDGVGISDEKKNAFGNGLMNMQQRMQQIGGKFSIESHKGGGTKIQITYPLK